jgi:hypothetical protein
MYYVIYMTYLLGWSFVQALVQYYNAIWANLDG